MRFLRPLVVAALAAGLVAGIAPQSTVGRTAPIIARVAPQSTVGPSLRAPILMYHHIVTKLAPGDDKGLVSTTASFTAQMKGLKAAGWTTMTSRAIWEHVRDGRRLPNKTFVLTFDDGNKDNILAAWPIMKEYGFVGTFYVIPNRFGGKMTPADWRTLAKAGNEIGNHTFNHANLKSLNGAQALMEMQLANSAIIKAGLPAPISLAYPFGAIDTDAINATRAAYIGLATTTVDGVFKIGMNMRTAPRIRGVSGMTAAGLIASMSR